MEQTELLNASIDELLAKAEGGEVNSASSATSALHYSLAHSEEDPRDKAYQLAATDEVYETGDGTVGIETETYIRDDASSRKVVELACGNLGRTRAEAAKFGALVEEEEWFLSALELREALGDLSAWVGLRLPTRLKMEVKRLLLWRLVYDTASESYYLENCSTGEAHDYGGQEEEEWGGGGVVAAAADGAASAAAGSGSGARGGRDEAAIGVARATATATATAIATATAATSAPARTEEQWACTNCTFINTGRDTEKCIVCRLPRLPPEDEGDDGPG